MSDSHFPTLVSKTSDPNSATNPISTQLTDGTTSYTALTDTQLRATPVPISGTVTANAGTGPFPVSDNGGSLTVDAVDLDIRNLNLTDDAVKVSANSTANSSGNPIYVSVVNAVAITGEIHNYNTAAAVAGGATSNHSYTAVATLLVKQISVSSSGACKVEFISDATGTPVTKFVGFIPKTGGTLAKTFDPAVELTTGMVARLTRTNREGAAQDLYSTIEGIDA